MAGHFGGNPYSWGGGANSPHISRYFIARGWVFPWEVVVDAACATGYGTKLISQIAKKAIGLEVDEGCIQDAKNTWGEDERCEYHIADLDKCELPEADVLISIESVEHLNDMYHFINEAKKKMRRLIIVCVPIGGTSWAYANEPKSPATEKNDFLNDSDVDKLVCDDTWKLQTGFRYGYSYFGVYYKTEPKKP